MTTEQKMFEDAFKTQMNVNFGLEMRKIYMSLKSAGFTRKESMELLKTLILAGNQKK